MSFVQPLPSLQIQVGNLGGQLIEGPQATANGPPQQQANQWQHHQRRPRNFQRNVLGQPGTPVQVNHHRNPAARIRAFRHKNAPSVNPGSGNGFRIHGGVAQRQPVRNTVAGLVAVHHQTATLPDQHRNRLYVLLLLNPSHRKRGSGPQGLRRNRFKAIEVHGGHLQQQVGSGHELPVGDFVCLMETGVIRRRNQRHPGHAQRHQRPGPQVSPQGPAFHVPSSRGMK